MTKSGNEYFVVPGAAGAMCMVIGQIAKKVGCHVIGIAGSDEKTKYLWVFRNLE